MLNLLNYLIFNLSNFLLLKKNVSNCIFKDFPKDECLKLMRSQIISKISYRKKAIEMLIMAFPSGMINFELHNLIIILVYHLL